MLKPLARTAAALACCATLLCAAPAAAKAPVATGIRSYPVLRHGALVLELPTDWRQEILQDPEIPLTVVLSPAAGDDFQAMISPLWKADGGAPLADPGDLQRLIDLDLEAMLPTAVEQEVPVRQIAGKDGPGYYFLVTDKAPKPGEYPYAVRAGVVVGDMLLSATILCRTKDSPGIAATIEALRTARQMGK